MLSELNLHTAIIENRKFERLIKINVLRDIKLLINGRFNGNNFVG